MSTIKYFGKDVAVDIAQQIHLAKRRLETLNGNYEVIISELERLYRWADKLMTETPIMSHPLPDEYFFQLMSVHILIVALLEFSLKCVGRPTKRGRLLDHIRKSPVLNDLEADWLILTVLIRHTLVHNFGRYDPQLAELEKKYIKKLRIVWPETGTFITTHSIDQSVSCLALLEKFVFLDVLSKDLIETEKQAFKTYFTIR
ncbi:hypothetical protein MUP05_03700 [Candidatus Bathyarchaeota archaeon]|nr:hypothetical protein [Candidatus Bathyarchaeota archaeon]